MRNSFQKFGDVDTSSPQNAFSSVLNSTANKNAVHQPPPAPSAFVAKKNPFAPPPVRHTDPPAPPQPQQVEEEEGEWAEALYDYDSTVSTLHIPCLLNILDIRTGRRGSEHQSKPAGVGYRADFR